MKSFSEEFKEQVRQTYRSLKSVNLTSQKTNINPKTIRIWCRDIIQEHKLENQNNIQNIILEMRSLYENDVTIADICRQLNVTEKMVYRECKDLIKTKQLQQDTIREKARDLYKNKGLSYTEISKQLNISKSTVSKHCRDLVDNRNPNAKALRKKQHSQDKIIKARKLFEENNSVVAIAEKLGVSDKCVYKWCSDLVKHKLLLKQNKIKEANELKEKTKRKSVFGIRSTRRELTDDQVIEMRRDIRQTGVKNFNKFSQKFGVSITTISCAVRGKTYKQVNHIEPPIDGTQYANNYSRSENPRFKLSDDLKNQVIEKRKADPYTRSYKKLADFLQEQTGKKYKSTHIAKLLFNHDPSLKELEKFDAPKPVKIREQKPKTPRPPKVKKELHPAIKAAMLKARRDKARQEREALKRMIEEEERYEREMQSLTN